MLPAGLTVFVREVLTLGLFWQICVLVILLLLLCEYVLCWWSAKRSDMPVLLNGLSISNILPFVRNRYDFLNWGFQSTGETVFRFRLLNVRVRHVQRAFFYVVYTPSGQKPVVAVSGETGRSTFLTAKGFDIHPGFKDLLGGVSPFSLAPFRARCL